LSNHRFNQIHLTNCLADPNAPKRSLSAYMIFANEQRDKVREDNPGIKFGEYHVEDVSMFYCTNM